MYNVDVLFFIEELLSCLTSSCQISNFRPPGSDALVTFMWHFHLDHDVTSWCCIMSQDSLKPQSNLRFNHVKRALFKPRSFVGELTSSISLSGAMGLILGTLFHTRCSCFVTTDVQYFNLRLSDRHCHDFTSQAVVHTGHSCCLYPSKAFLVSGPFIWCWCLWYVKYNHNQKAVVILNSMLNFLTESLCSIELQS